MAMIAIITKFMAMMMILTAMMLTFMAMMTILTAVMVILMIISNFKGAEFPVLKTIPWEKVDIKAISVETHFAGIKS